MANFAHCLLGVLFLSLPSITLSNELSGSFEAGHQFAVQVTDGDVTRERPYVGFYGRYEMFRTSRQKSLLDLNAGVRGWVNNAHDGEVDLRMLNLGYATPTAKATVGFQEIRWGNSFAFFPADLVTPRDLRDPLFSDPAWTPRPNFTLTSEFLQDDFRFQIFVTPVPRNNLYQTNWHGQKIEKPRTNSLSDFGEVFEIGAKTSLKVGPKTTADFFYLWHWNRNSVFEMVTTPRGPELIPVVERTHTVGVLFKRQLGNWTLHNDSVFHLSQPFQTNPDSEVLRTPVFESVFGADIKLENDFTVSLQYQAEYWFRGQRHWVGAKAHRSFLNHELEVDAMIYQGINNSDLWIEPGINWHFLPNWSIALRTDIISRWSDQDTGYLYATNAQSRIMSWVSYKL